MFIFKLTKQYHLNQGLHSRERLSTWWWLQALRQRDFGVQAMTADDLKIVALQIYSANTNICNKIIQPQPSYHLLCLGFNCKAISTKQQIMFNSLNLSQQLNKLEIWFFPNCYHLHVGVKENHISCCCYPCFSLGHIAIAGFTKRQCQTWILLSPWIC